MNSVSELYVDAEHTNSHTAGSFEVEHGVPLPVKAPKPPKGKKGRASRYPFRSMSPGDSFFMPGVETKKALGAVQTGRKAFPGSRWTVKAVDNGVRVWRVS